MKKKSKKKGQHSATVLWAREGDAERWPALAQGLNAVDLRLLERNLSWARTQCAGAWSLVNGMLGVIEHEQARRVVSSKAEGDE